MSATRRMLYGVGAMVALAAMVIAGAYLMPSSVRANPAAAVSTLDDADLKLMLPSDSALPAGMDINRMSLAEAMSGTCASKSELTSDVPIEACSAGFMKGADMVFTPAACGQDTIAAGFGEPTKGQVQVGSLTSANGERRDQFTLAATVPGGTRFDLIREGVAACKAGKVSLRDQGLSGTVSLSEFSVPAMRDAETFGLLITMSMAGTTTTEAMVFVRIGGLLLAACDPVYSTSVEMATAMHRRALSILS
ncbi:MAG TPA: hypothetical protein VFT95_23810 [Micromonosporaceae bacterium]|nr:hypothetical protein [Micromonosporaceae bacterium]